MKVVDYKNIFKEVKANHKKLRECPRHKVDPSTWVFGHKMTCLNCGGQIQGTDLSQYIQGYEAHGGNSDDIWPGYREVKT